MFFSLPNERCGGLRIEHPGSACVSYVCVCSSRPSHSVSSSPCVSVGWSGQSFCLCAGENWLSLRYLCLVWLHHSRCFYFVPQALYLQHPGWCLDCLSGHFVYPESFYCMETYFRPLM